MAKRIPKKKKTKVKVLIFKAKNNILDMQIKQLAALTHEKKKLKDAE